VTTGRNGRLGPADGVEVELAGARILTKVTAEQTEGRYAFIEARNPPGWESELNRHPHDSKVFYVLEGSYEFFTGGQWGDVCPGDTLLVKAGDAHGFRAGPDGGRVLVIYPGRSAAWFTDAATTCGPGRPGTAQHAFLHDRNHVQSLGPLPRSPDGLDRHTHPT
jgi:quercetin dioxygenase-like cupin family protein